MRRKVNVTLVGPFSLVRSLISSCLRNSCCGVPASVSARRTFVLPWSFGPIRIVVRSGAVHHSRLAEGFVGGNCGGGQNHSVPFGRPDILSSIVLDKTVRASSWFVCCMVRLDTK